MFSSTQKSSAVGVYADMKKFLAEKDGKTHIVMVNSFSKFINQFFGCESKYTVQLDTIISQMQEDGYEIIDVKFNSVKDQGVLNVMEGFHTLIIYK